MNNLFKNFTTSKKKVIAIALAVSTVLAVGTTSILQFTDVLKIDAGGFSSGIVECEIDGAVVDAGSPAFIPGDIRSKGFTVKNMGDTAVDVKSTVILNCDKSLEGTDSTQSVFDIYRIEDVEGDDERGYTPKDGATPLPTKKISNEGKTITYELEYSLDGNHELLTGYESIGDLSGDSDTAASMYVILFKLDSGNEWQEVPITLDVMAEAKQHRYTQKHKDGSDITWTELETSTVTFNGATVNSVPDRV